MPACSFPSETNLRPAIGFSGALLWRAKPCRRTSCCAPSTTLSRCCAESGAILTHVTIDTDGVADFNRRVYAIARTIPPGATLSYGEIAERLGDRSLARDVGQALGQNPIPIIVPCHRVLAVGGKMGGFSAPGGVVTKLRLLTIEGAQPNGPTLFDRLPLSAPRRL